MLKNDVFTLRLDPHRRSLLGQLAALFGCSRAAVLKKLLDQAAEAYLKPLGQKQGEFSTDEVEHDRDYS